MFFTCICGKSTYGLAEECQYCGMGIQSHSLETVEASRSESGTFDKKQMRLFDVEPEQE